MKMKLIKIDGFLLCWNKIKNILLLFLLYFLFFHKTKFFQRSKILFLQYLIVSKDRSLSIKNESQTFHKKTKFKFAGEKLQFTVLLMEYD